MDCDVAVLGGGPAGYTAAIRAAQLGGKVVCVDKAEALGGTCLRVGCIPTKAWVQSAHALHDARETFAKLGVGVGEPTLDFPGIQAFLAKYQERAAGEGVDPLGHYLPPFAYAYMQVLGDAVEAVGSLDQEALANYIRDHTFETVVGPVKFGPNGEWATSRVLMVQLQNIEDGDLEQFRNPGKRVVILPEQWASGDLIFPYTDAKK